MEIHLRSLDFSDICAVVKFYKEEEWVTSVRTIKSEIEHFGRDTFLAAYNDNGELLGTCAVYRLTEWLAYVDYVFVSKAHRGHGLAKVLLRAAIDKAKHSNIVLDSTPKYLPLYMNKFGFRQEQPRYAMTFVIPERCLPERIRPHPTIKNVTKDNIKEVMGYDKSLHPLGHRSYFEQMLLDKNNTSLCSVVDGKVNGLLEYSPSERLLNALYADSQSVASNLLSTFFWLLSGNSLSLQSTLNGSIRSILLEHNVNFFMACLKDFNVQVKGPTLESIRMVSRAKITNVAYERLYCIMYDVYII